MMIETEAQARARAEAFLASEIQPATRHELVIMDVTGYANSWVAIFNSRRFAETGETSDALAGNGPIIINRRTGAVRLGVTAKPIEEQLDDA